MFTIEHTFDATEIVLIDEGPSPLHEDVTIRSYSDYVTVEQFDNHSDQKQKITLSYKQLSDLAASLNLPEGAYQLQSTRNEP